MPPDRGHRRPEMVEVTREAVVGEPRHSVISQGRGFGYGKEAEPATIGGSSRPSAQLDRDRQKCPRLRSLRSRQSGPARARRRGGDPAGSRPPPPAQAAPYCAPLKQRDVGLHIINLGGDVTGNGISKLVLTILSAVAEAERDRIRERILDVKSDQRKRNRFLGGTVPFGRRWARTARWLRYRSSRAAGDDPEDPSTAPGWAVAASHCTQHRRGCLACHGKKYSVPIIT